MNWTNNSYRNSPSYVKTVKVKPVISASIRKEAVTPTVLIPTIKTDAKQLVVALRKSELNKSAALKACVAQVDKAK